MSSSDLTSLLNNKRVVIVGPSPYLNDLGLGETIDSYDTIIRINQGHKLVKNPTIFGSRTDILYHCVCQGSDNGGKITDVIYNDVQYIVAAIPLLLPGDKKTSFSTSQQLLSHHSRNHNLLDATIKKIDAKKTKYTVINKEFYINLEKEMGCRPNTGLVAIFDIISNYTPMEVYITGFTFFKDGYSNLYRNTIDGKHVTEKSSNKAALDRMSKGCHKSYMMFKYFQNYIKQYDLKFDKILQDMLEFDLDTYRNDNKLFDKTDNDLFNHYLLST